MPTNQLHPLNHSYSFMPGSRIDMEQVLPKDISEVDIDELIDQLSEPPKFIERIAPVSTVINTDIIRGRNWTEMMIKVYRQYLRILTQISFFIRQALAEKFEERNMIPFMSLHLTPDVLHRIVEMDYEQGENTYAAYMEFFRVGTLAPTATVPFNVLLPTLDSDFDRRLCIRAGLLFYWKILEDYNKFVAEAHGDPLFVIPFWFPECGYSQRTLAILHEEAYAMAKAHKIKKLHIVLMLDNVQTQDCDLDVLMKSWNQVKMPGGDTVSIVFRDRGFSEWVIYSNPSVKKLIDRTIAKVDSELNEQGVDYCWNHVEDIESITFTSKSAMNFEQKIIKLAQLSYMAMSADFFTRRKMHKEYSLAAHEPQAVKLRENSAWNNWHPTPSFGRWLGLLDSNARFPLVDENRPYMRRTRTGKIQENGHQCWKIAFTRMRQRCVAELKGILEPVEGGFIEVLASICGVKDQKVVARNVADFLTHYTLVHFREHFIQHDHSEADTHLDGLVRDHLMRDTKKRAKPAEVVMAGVAAQGYFFALDSLGTHATQPENFDQRSVYQSVTMLTLAIRNMMFLAQWRKKPDQLKKLVEMVKTELFDFKSAFDRYRLADYGVTRQEWEDVLRPMADDTTHNIVERAARRVAARHLKPLGLKKDFPPDDAHLSTNVGHIWSTEVENTNYKWENKLFCGMREE